MSARHHWMRLKKQKGFWWQLLFSSQRFYSQFVGRYQALLSFSCGYQTACAAELCYEAKHLQQILRSTIFSVHCTIRYGIVQHSRNGLLWPTTDSYGERLVLWQCRLIWGVLFSPKAKHRRAEWKACLANLTRHPRILAGRKRTQDQGSPLHKYRRGHGSSGELTQSFHPREAHFRGMWHFPHLDRSPPWALWGYAEPWIERHGPSDPFVLFWSCISVYIALPGPDTAVGRSG